jgi:hypothetical protein
MRDARLTHVLLVSLALTSGGLLADSAWTVPGVVNAGGLNGTHFVSDLTVTNPGTAAANVVLSFFPGSSSPKNFTLNPGKTIVYSDVAGVTFGVSGGAGALSITSDQPLLIRAKTYNTAASGTYGVALPVVSTDRLLSPGDVGDSLWITQDASGAAGYRTNIAVAFPDDSGGEATVTVYDADGNARGSQDFSLGSAGLKQFSVGSFAGAVSVGRAQIVVTRGHAAGYAVVVDNVTGDSSLFAFEDMPAGIQDVLVNGVARASGRNGAFFRTDGRFYNPTNADATVQVAFHASGNANPAPSTASFTVPAGKILDVVDVLASLLGLPVGSAGALRFQSSSPVAILCRTSNVDPSGARPGTFGSQQKPVPLLSFVSSADAGAVVTGIRQDTDFRTNVGFAAGADGAQYTLTLQDASGATVATTSASLGAFGWAQPGIQDLFQSITIPGNATLRVNVTAGSVDVFDSSIDNLSGDPVVTPIAPLPAAIPSSATIGPQGGSIRSDDGRLTLRIPAGALAQATAFSFQTTTSDAPQGIGPGYQIQPTGLAFAKPALLTAAYGRDDTNGSSAEALTLGDSDTGGWYALGGGSLDPARRTLTVPLPSTAASVGTASRRPLTVPGTLAFITSWQFVPAGNFTALVDGRLNFTVNFVGYSSSLIEPGQGRLLLSSSPNAVEVSWWVNGIELGNPANGVIVTQGTSGTYIAPSCPPGRNPVRVEAHIANKNLPFLPYEVSGHAHIRVLPRKWSLQWFVTAATDCQGQQTYSDLIDWAPNKPTIQFTLDDNFHGSGTQTFLPASHNLKACPVCPYGTASISSQGTDTPMTVLVTADWNTSDDIMDLHVYSGYFGPQGAFTQCTTPLGPQMFAIPEVLAFDYGLRLQAKDTYDVTDPLAPWSIGVSAALDGVCP